MIPSPYKIISAYFVESGTTPDMGAFSIGTHLDPPTVAAYQERTHGGQMLQPDNLAGVAGRILIDTPGSERQVIMPGGLQHKRLRFLIRAAIPGMTDGLEYVYSGYTDYNSWNPVAKDFDPNMRLFINNITGISKTIRMTPTGPEPHIRVLQCNHLIHPSLYGMQNNPFQTSFDPMGMGMLDSPTALRPSDIMAKMANDAINGHDQAMGNGMGSIDTRPTMDLMFIDRRNINPSNYLSTTLSGLNNGFLEAADNIGTTDPSAPFESAYGKVQEKTPFSDSILNPLITEAGLQQNGFVLWSSMVAIHPEIMNTGVTRYKSNLDVVDQYVPDHNDYGQTLHNLSQSTKLYNRVMSILPGFLLASMVVFCRVHVTNQTLTGAIECQVMEPVSYADLPAGFLIPSIPLIEERIRSLIMQDTGLPEHVMFDAHFTIDAFGESFGAVSVNQEQSQLHVSPSYGDATGSQMVSNSVMPLHGIAHDIKYLVTKV